MLHNDNEVFEPVAYETAIKPLQKIVDYNLF
jgi:hypothetical protein